MDRNKSNQRACQRFQVYPEGLSRGRAYDEMEGRYGPRRDRHNRSDV